MTSTGPPRRLGTAAPWYGPRQGTRKGVTAFFTDFGSNMEIEVFEPLSYSGERE